jgi:hypothetical protein
MSFPRKKFYNHITYFEADWDELQNNIGNYGMEKYNKSLFHPFTRGVPPGVTADFTTPATATRPLKVYHAGSLATSFGKLEKMFEKALYTLELYKKDLQKE